MLGSVCLLNNFILGFSLTRKTGEFGLASHITLVLQTNRLTKYASQLRRREVIVKQNSDLLSFIVWPRDSGFLLKVHGLRVMHTILEVNWHFFSVH